MKTYRFFSLLMVAAFLVSSCGPLAPAKKLPPLKVGWSLWPGWYPLVIAQEKGFFREHGVEVDLRLYPLYNQTLAELDSGKTDAAVMVVGDALQLAADGRTKIVMVTDTSNGGDSIMAPADITSPADLRGKRIGVGLGTFGELLVREMLKRNNISISDVTLVDVPPEQLPAALGNTVDVGHTFPPFTSQAEQKGYHAVFSSAETPGLIADVVVFRSGVTTERPNDVRAFITAFFEAQDWWFAHQTEAASIIAKATGQKPEDITVEGLKLFNKADNAAAFQLSNNTTSLSFTTQLYSDFQIETGRLNTAPDFKQLLDSSFLPK